jgi:hypothetical protein
MRAPAVATPRKEHSQKVGRGSKTGKDGAMLKQDLDLVFLDSPKPLEQTALPPTLVTNRSTLTAHPGGQKIQAIHKSASQRKSSSFHMKVGIDSYSYHRFFGEVYPNQQPAPKHYTMDSFLDRAKQLECGGVSLESCFFADFNPSYLKTLRKKLDDYGIESTHGVTRMDSRGEETRKQNMRCFSTLTTPWHLERQS